MSLQWNIDEVIPCVDTRKTNMQGGEGSQEAYPFGPQPMDNHDGLTDLDKAEEILKELNETLSDDEKEELKEMIEDHFEEDPAKGNDPNAGAKEAGKGVGGIWTFAKVGRVRKKKKWETVIKKWAVRELKLMFKPLEQWIRINRRFALVSNEFFLPTEMEVEELAHEVDRIEVWFFQDTSGSCAGFKDRFFAAALSLPEKKFKVRMFCFDTQVYETDLESKKLYGFGGTTFDCIETHIQKTMKQEGIKYPRSVFVISDGFGSSVNPQIPERWYWFLSEDHDAYIPKKSHKFMLKDYE